MTTVRSLIKIRYAVGAMLAMSALLAVVLSISFGSDDTALGEDPTNQEKLDNAITAFETAVANPNKDIDDLKTSAVLLGDANLNWEDPDDGQDNTQVSIVPTMTSGSFESAAGAEVGDGVGIKTALDAPTGTSWLGSWTEALANARTDETKHLTDTGSFTDSDYSGESVSKDFTDLEAANVVAGGIDYSLQQSTKDKLDTKLSELLRTSDTHDAEAYLGEVTKILIDGGYYGDADSDATTPDVLLEGLTDFASPPTGATVTGVTDALAALYTKTTATPPVESGSLVHLKKRRADEKKALAGVNAILVEVDKQIDAAKKTFDDNPDDATFNFPTADGTLTTRAKVLAEIAKAKGYLTDLLNDFSFISSGELTAQAEWWDVVAILGVDVLGNEAQDANLSWIDTVAWARLEEILDALLKKNTDDLNAIGSPGDTNYRPDLIDVLKTDATNHISDALGTLSDLDGTDAQKTAIHELIDLLTKVDDLHVAAAPLATATPTPPATGDIDINDDDLSKGEVAAYKNVVSKFKALKTTLADKNIDTAVDTDGAGVATSGVDADFDALVKLENDEFGGLTNGVHTTVNQLATALTGKLGETSGNAPTAAATALLTKLKTGILASAVSDTDLTVTDKELAAALGLDYDDNGTSAVTTDDKVRTDDLGVVLGKLRQLDDDIRSVHAVQNLGSTPIWMDVVASEYEDHIVSNFAKVRAAANSYRASTLQYPAFASMSALLMALDEVLEAGRLDQAKLTSTNAVAKKALIAAYKNKGDYNADTQAHVTAAYNILVIGPGSAANAHKQRAGFNTLRAFLLGIETGDITEKINASMDRTQSPAQEEAQAMITKIEPSISNVTVSGGDKVKLSVKVYGLQGLVDQDLADDVTFDWGDASSDTTASITYTAPTAPGSYDVTASLAPNECYDADETERVKKCSANFTVKVKRDAPPQPEEAAPVNPPPPIPTILTDGDGNNYEVFTPVEGGTFDSGDGYSIVAASGDVPNNEIIGVRMSDDGSASNAGMTHQRYTLAGNMYGIHVVDGTGTMVTSYQLDAGAQVCLPLPDALKSNISQIAMVTINANDTLTVLSASVKIGASGTMVCGNISGLPASVAVGSAGAPDAIPTATPEPTPEPPDTGGTAPSNTNGILIWLTLLGLAATGIGTTLARRRQTSTR